MKCLILFLLLSTTSFSQSDIDNDNKSYQEKYEDFMSISNPSSQDIEDGLLLAKEYYEASLDTTLLIAEKCVEWSKKSEDQEQCCQAMIYLAKINNFAGKADASLSLLEEAENLAVKIDNSISKAAINTLYGSIANDKGEFERAIDYYLKAAELYGNAGEKEGVGNAYVNVSGIFFDNNQLDKAHEYNQKIGVLAEELDSDKLRIDAGGLEGIFLMTKGIHYYLANQLDTANIQSTIDTLNSYFQRSEVEYDQTISIARKNKDAKMTLTLLNNMVALANNMEKHDRAVKLALEAEEIANGLGSRELQVQSQTNLSSIYRRKKEYEKALDYGKRALNTAKQYNFERKVTLANRQLYNLYIEMGRLQEALEVAEEIRAYDLKINNAENTRAIAEIETKYETVKKEKQILNLETNNNKIKTQRNYLLGGGLILGVLAFFGFRMNRLRKERNDKKAFSEALLLAQEDERKKIARDLHDGIGQSLLLLKKQMEKSNEMTSANQEMISETLEEVRSLSRDLHPFQLDKFGLTATVEEMIHKIQTNTDLFITKDIVNIDHIIPKTSSIHVYRTIQEALSNIIKHAEATAAKVSFKSNDTNTVISIQDNGKGFDPELTVAKRKSLGLKTMHERIATIGGQFKIENGDSKGTIVSITLPKLNN